MGTRKVSHAERPLGNGPVAVLAKAGRILRGLVPKSTLGQTVWPKRFGFENSIFPFCRRGVFVLSKRRKRKKRKEKERRRKKARMEEPSAPPVEEEEEDETAGHPDGGGVR